MKKLIKFKNIVLVITYHLVVLTVGLLVSLNVIRSGVGDAKVSLFMQEIRACVMRQRSGRLCQQCRV